MHRQTHGASKGGVPTTQRDGKANAKSKRSDKQY